MTETVLSAKSKIFTTYLFTENFADSILEVEKRTLGETDPLKTEK